MTRAEIITAVRNLVNEMSSDAGALLDDDGNLKEYVNDAQEQVVLDLLQWMPGHLMTSETVSLIAGQSSYAITTNYWQVWKVEWNLSGQSPREIPIIDPLESEFYITVGETDTEPRAVYFLGDTMYVVPIPASSVANNIKLWLVRSEAVLMGVNGPSYLPPVAHRLIVYQAAILIATSLEKDPSLFTQLYARRFQKIVEAWRARFQQKPRFVNPPLSVRQTTDARDPALYDKEWPYD